MLGQGAWCGTARYTGLGAEPQDEQNHVTRAKCAQKPWQAEQAKQPPPPDTLQECPPLGRIYTRIIRADKLRSQPRGISAIPLGSSNSQFCLDKAGMSFLPCCFAVPCLCLWVSLFWIAVSWQALFFISETSLMQTAPWQVPSPPSPLRQHPQPRLGVLTRGINSSVCIFMLFLLGLLETCQLW